MYALIPDWPPRGWMGQYVMKATVYGQIEGPNLELVLVIPGPLLHSLMAQCDSALFDVIIYFVIIGRTGLYEENADFFATTAFLQKT